MASPRHAPLRTSTGMVMQAGLPKVAPPDAIETTFLVRGVVTAVYVVDDPAHPYHAGQPCACYCDVVVYTKLAGGRTWPLQHVLVSQEVASAQGGAIRLPRAASQSLAGDALDPSADVDFTSLDGDHVLIGFIDHNRQQPVILRYLPHPRADVGIAGSAAPGHRTRLRLVDGAGPDLRKHHGGFYGLDGAGNFVADASAACSGALTPAGAEVPGDGTGGVRLVTGPAGSRQTTVAGATADAPPLAQESLSAAGLALTFLASPGGFSISGSAGPLLAIAAPGAGGAPTAGIQVGTGGTAVARADATAAALNQILIWLAAHTHPSVGSPPAPTPPLPPASTPAGLAARGLSVPT